MLPRSVRSTSIRGLPRYAGLNAPSWAIYHGEHGNDRPLDERCDRRRSDRLPGHVRHRARDTGLSVAMRCVRLGIPLIAKVVEAAGGRAAIPRIEQRLDERTYFPPGPPLDGRVEWAARLAGSSISCGPRTPPSVRVSLGPSPDIHGDTGSGDYEGLLNRGADERQATGHSWRYSGRGALVAAADEWVLIERARLGDRRPARRDSQPRNAARGLALHWGHRYPW